MSQWVTPRVHISVNHHLRRIEAAGALTECGVRIALYQLGPFPEVAECRSCAEHVYARDNQRPCPHCHKDAEAGRSMTAYPISPTLASVLRQLEECMDGERQNTRKCYDSIAGVSGESDSILRGPAVLLTPERRGHCVDSPGVRR